MCLTNTCSASQNDDSFALFLCKDNFLGKGLFTLLVPWFPYKRCSSFQCVLDSFTLLARTHAIYGHWTDIAHFRSPPAHVERIEARRDTFGCLLKETCLDRCALTGALFLNGREELVDWLVRTDIC